MDKLHKLGWNLQMFIKIFVSWLKKSILFPLRWQYNHWFLDLCPVSSLHSHKKLFCSLYLFSLYILSAILIQDIELIFLVWPRIAFLIFLHLTILNDHHLLDWSICKLYVSQFTNTQAHTHPHGLHSKCVNH